MIFRQAAQVLSRRLPASTRKATSSLLATTSVCTDVVHSPHLQMKRDIWIWGSSPSSSTSPNRGFADAAVETASDSHWAHFPMAPPDPIIGLTEVSCGIEDVSSNIPLIFDISFNHLLCNITSTKHICRHILKTTFLIK